MFSKKQLVVTAVAMITGSVFINLLWIINKCYREGNAGMPVSLILVYLAVVAAGIVVAAIQNVKAAKFTTLLNCVATANLCVSITGAVFMYFGDGNRLSMKIIPLLLPLFIGILILEKIFFRVKSESKVS